MKRLLVLVAAAGALAGCGPVKSTSHLLDAEVQIQAARTAGAEKLAPYEWTAANLYIVAFGVSWGPVMWVLLGEMFPNGFRGAALAIAGATNWATNFIVTVTFLPMVNAVGLAGAYVLYAIAAVVSLRFVWTAVRETKGKTLEQM